MKWEWEKAAHLQSASAVAEKGEAKLEVALFTVPVELVVDAALGDATARFACLMKCLS